MKFHKKYQIFIFDILQVTALHQTVEGARAARVRKTGRLGTEKGKGKGKNTPKK